jgi:2-haloacid dehalogenase
VHPAHVFKPHASVYRIAEDELGVPRTMMGFVSSNGWDAAGAKSFGFRAYWVNRGGAPVERLGVRPDAIVANLSELNEALK